MTTKPFKVWGTCSTCGKRRYLPVTLDEPRPDPFVCGVCSTATNAEKPPTK